MKRNMSNGGDNFDRAISKASIAQICENLGFQGFRNFALELLSDIALKYIHSVGEAARSCANLAGRTECNAFDIVQGLDNLLLGIGFADATDACHCLASSGTVRDIVTYIGQVEDVPFAYSISHFPVLRDREPSPSFLQRGEEPPDEHIPPWLPTFPGSQSYTKKLKEFGGETDGSWSDGRNMNGLKREDHLWHKHFDSADGCEVADAVGAAECNPFLMVPLLFGDRELSTVPSFSKVSIVKEKKSSDLDVEDHVLHQMFDPGIEMVGSDLCRSQQRKKKEPFVDRPPIKFKLGIMRKLSVVALDSSLRN